MARIIPARTPADFGFLAGGMGARIADSTPAAKTGISLGELRRELPAPAEDVAPRLVGDFQLLAGEGFHSVFNF